MLPTGSTSNEALHKDMNNPFSPVMQYHQTTLKMRLRMINTGKLLSHDSALFRQTTFQMRPQPFGEIDRSTHCAERECYEATIEG